MTEEVEQPPVHITKERRKTLVMWGARFRKDLERKGWKITDAGIGGEEGDYHSHQYIIGAEQLGFRVVVFCGHDTESPKYLLREPGASMSDKQSVNQIPTTESLKDWGK